MIMKIEKKDIKFQSQMTGQQLVDILTSKYCYIHFDIKLAKMKFWGLRDICCSLVQYIKKYFHKQTKTQENKSVKSNIKKKKNAVPYVPRRGLYRFDANEISDSFESSRAFKMIKTKKISKQEKFVPKIQTRENFKPEQQEKASTKQGFVDDSGDEISSISSNNDSDSIGTIKQFLVNLDPKLQKSINFFARYKKRKEREAQESKNNNLQFKIGIKQNKPISKLRQIPNFMKKTNKIPIYGYESLKQQIIENSQKPKELGYQSLKKQWTKKPY